MIKRNHLTTFQELEKWLIIVNKKHQQIDYRLFLQFYFKTTAADIISNYEQSILISKNHFRKKYYQLLKGRSLAHTFGFIFFFTNYFVVAKKVFTPRPETELLVEFAIKEIVQYPNRKIIFELGTGTGVIALTLAQYFPNKQVYASDSSKRAINNARLNAKKLGIRNIIFLHEKGITPFSKLEQKCDFFISNPPYLTKNNGNSQNKIKDEPKKALFSSNKGSAFYQQILEQNYTFAKQNCIFLFEIDHNQDTIIKNYSQCFLGQPCRILNDYKGFHRIAIINGIKN